MVVLGSLIAGMTLASGVLLVLEPHPVSPGSQILLNSLDRQSDPYKGLFSTTPDPDPRRYSLIVIHHSGALQGSSDALARVHDKLDRGGLGYHFVIGNGKGMPDGQIDVGFRWTRQLVGHFSTGPGSEIVNRRGIGVCLIGDVNRESPTDAQMRELLWLVQKLQARFNIPADQIIVQAPPDEKGSPGRFFPIAQFRQQLLTPTAVASVPTP